MSTSIKFASDQLTLQLNLLVGFNVICLKWRLLCSNVVYEEALKCFEER